MPSVSKAPKWDVHRLSRAEGWSVLVTGGSAGIGYFVAEQLAGTGATVVLGSRDAAKAEAAIASIGSRVPGAEVRYVPMDLADPASLEAAVDARAGPPERGRPGQGSRRVARRAGSARPERARRPDVEPAAVRAARNAQERTSPEPPDRPHDRGPLWPAGCDLTGIDLLPAPPTRLDGAAADS